MQKSWPVLVGAAAALLLMGATRLWPDPLLLEGEAAGRTDYGRGAGRPAGWLAHQPAAIPKAPTTANVTGWFGAPVPWPIVPIHMALLPDGRVMSFGSTESGVQGAALSYDVWSPSAGTGADSHLVLPNTTATNIFCSGQALLPGLGLLAMVGGTLGQGNLKTYNGINNVTVFVPTVNAVAAAPPLVFPRWYPSMLPLPNGQVFLAGGTAGPPGGPIATPELYDPNTGWNALPNAASAAAFAKSSNWFYPRIFLAPAGNLIDLTLPGMLYTIDPTGVAPTTRIASTLSPAPYSMPAAQVAPGLILSMRGGNAAQLIDLTGPTPAVTNTAPLDQQRDWSNMTILADGTVLVTGGSAVPNKLVGVDNTALIWNPAAGTWTTGATAAIPRLYHSAALLLPDGTVLTGGGGDPGPVRNMNAEIYYPPYLYAADGSPAPQPAIVSAPATAVIGGTLTLTVGTGNTIGAVTMLRAGASTHSLNLEQRFFSLSFTQSGQQVSATLPGNLNEFSPGTYMIFVFENGVPSPASLIEIIT